MLGKLFTTKRGHLIVNSVAAVFGVVLVIAIDRPRDGTVVFLAVTATESGMFSLVYGLRSAWRKSEAARAVFWAVFAYFLLATELLIGFIRPYRYDWFDDVRELLYLGLAIAGLNLLLTLGRLLGWDALYRR